MAGIDVGAGRSGRRELNHDLPLVPFIDFLLCMVAFLLVTAVWSEMARHEASAEVPGAIGALTPPEKQPVLHVDMRKGSRFLLEWRLGSTVIGQTEVARKDTYLPDGTVQFPALATEVERVWAKEGAHRAPTDLRRDRAVLHASNAATYEEIVAGMDAIRAATRPIHDGRRTPAFDVVFAAD